MYCNPTASAQNPEKKYLTNPMAGAIIIKLISTAYCPLAQSVSANDAWLMFCISSLASFAYRLYVNQGTENQRTYNILPLSSVG